MGSLTEGNKDNQDSVYFRRKRAFVLFARRAGVPRMPDESGLSSVRKRFDVPGPPDALPFSFAVPKLHTCVEFFLVFNPSRNNLNGSMEDAFVECRQFHSMFFGLLGKIQVRELGARLGSDSLR
jgi:hypothetical protein